MLVAILLGILFGAGGSAAELGELMLQYTKDPIKSVVVDKDRRASALKELSIMEDGIDDLNKQVSKDLKKYEKLIMDYDSKPEDFDALFAATLIKRETEVEALWGHRTDLLQHINADEWQLIMASANAAMKKSNDKKAK